MFGNGFFTNSIIPDSLLWKPSNITTVLWLDSSDISSLSLDVNRVVQWRDKSGNARHANTAQASGRPLYINSETGLVFEFDAMESSFFSYNELSYFIVAKRIGNASNTFNNASFLCEVGVVNATPFNSGRICQIVYDTTVFSSTHISGNTNTSSALTTARNDNTNIHFSAHKFGVNGYINYFVNGTSIGTTNNSNSQVIGTPVFRIGAASTWVNTLLSLSNTSNSIQCHANIAEIIAIDKILTIEERQKIEGYLAHKWRLTANLDITHPYKFYPPTI